MASHRQTASCGGHCERHLKGGHKAIIVSARSTSREAAAGPERAVSGLTMMMLPKKCTWRPVPQGRFLTELQGRGLPPVV
jgi:hypothetical protein